MGCNEDVMIRGELSYGAHPPILPMTKIFLIGNLHKIKKIVILAIEANNNTKEGV